MDRLPASAPPDPLVGTVLDGRYLLVELVGQGEAATVYRAQDVSTQQQVACKLLRPTAASSTRHARFERESQILRRLSHPGIVRYLSHGDCSTGQPYLVTEWLSGQPLSQHLASAQLSVDQCLSLLRQIASALRLAHEATIVHRDLKPSNIFLRDHSLLHPVLLDFGIARPLSDAHRVTQQGLSIGTLHYIAPELSYGKGALTPAADIYSLGCVMYECLTGHPPQHGNTLDALMYMLTQAPAPSPVRWEHASPQLEALLDSMLSADPAKRPADAGALLEALARIPQRPAWLRHRSGVIKSQVYRHADVVLMSQVLITPSDANGTPADAAPWNIEQILGLLTDRVPATELSAWAEADGSLRMSIGSARSAPDLALAAVQLAEMLVAARPGWIAVICTGYGFVFDHQPLGPVTEQLAEALAALRRGTPSDVPRPALQPDALTWQLYMTHPLAVPSVLPRTDLAAQQEFSRRRALQHLLALQGRQVDLGDMLSKLHTVIEDAVPVAMLLIDAIGLEGPSLLDHVLVCAGDVKPAITIWRTSGNPQRRDQPYGLILRLVRQIGSLSADAPASAQWDALNTALDTLLVHDDAEAKAHTAHWLGVILGIAAHQNPASVAALRPHTATHEQVRLAFRRVVRATLARGPLLWACEGLHDSDRESADLIALFLSSFADLPSFFVALARPEFAERLPQSLTSKCQIVHLLPISRTSAERLMQLALRTQPSPDLCEWLHDHGAKSPALLEDLLHHVELGRPAEVPPTTLALIAGHLSTLEPQARQVLRAASIVGLHFWRSAVAVVAASWLGSDGIDLGLARLLREQIIERQPNSQLGDEAGFTFRQSLYRDTAYQMLTEIERSNGHRAAGRYLAGFSQIEPAELAHHAQGAQDMPLFAQRAVEAAWRAFRAGDATRALGWVRKGLAVHPPAAVRGPLHHLACLIGYWQDDFEQARVDGFAALDLLPRESPLWLQTLGWLLFVTSIEPDASAFHRLIGELTSAAVHDALREAYLEALTLLVGALGIRAAQRPAQAFFHLLAKERARLSPDLVSANGGIYWARAFLMLTFADNAQAGLLLSQESLQFAQTAHIAHMQASSLVLLARAHANLGQAAQSEARYQEAQVYAQQLRSPLLEVHAQMWRMQSLCLAGTAASLDLGAELARTLLLRPTLNGIARLNSHLTLAQHALAQGYPQAAQEALACAEPLLRGFPHAQCKLLALRIECALAAAAPEDLPALIAQVETLLGPLTGCGANEPAARLAVVRAHQALGNTAAARDALSQALQVLHHRARDLSPGDRLQYLQGPLAHRAIVDLARAGD